MPTQAHNIRIGIIKATRIQIVSGEVKAPRTITQQRRIGKRGASRRAEEASSETKLRGMIREGDARRGIIAFVDATSQAPGRLVTTKRRDG